MMPRPQRMEESFDRQKKLVQMQISDEVCACENWSSSKEMDSTTAAYWDQSASNRARSQRVTPWIGSRP